MFAALILSMALYVAPGTVCDLELQAAGLCGTATSDGSQVDVSGSMTVPGASNSGDGSGNPPAATAPPTAGPEAESDTDPTCVSDLCRPLYGVATLPDVTAADLVSFRPHAPTAAGEPAGLGVAGMPTNLIATASTHDQHGALLGYDVTVRFTPIGFHFDHGDGTSHSTTTGGSAWATLGLPDYSPTATSHVYTSAGAYRAAVSVTYRASVNFGTGSWRAVTGTVQSAASGYDVRVVNVDTALVLRTCIENPRGPGC